MEELKNIIIEKNYIEEVENNYLDITDELEGINEELNEEVTELKINNRTYFIIMLQCDYCKEKFYYFSKNSNYSYIEHIRENEGEHNCDYDFICNDCFDDNFCTCDCCGKIIEINDSCYFNDATYCSNCYDEYVTICEHCGVEIETEDAIRTANDEYICNNCYYDNFFTCDNCGEVHHLDNFNEYDGYDYCDDCYNEIEKDCQFDYYNATNRKQLTIDKPLKEYCNCNAICDYHDNPIPFEKRKIENEQNELYFGVELEITNRNYGNKDKASHFVANNLYCRIENDTSISFEGFEIISDPATLNFWKYRKNKIEQVFNELKNNGYISHNADNCGLHIHASRNGLGETIEEQEKVIDNIILICENFKEELKIFSRRNRFNWCHFLIDSTDAATEGRETNIKKIKDTRKNKDRYQVINTQNNNTIEFRLNRGTLNINTFFASIELFYNIIELAKTNNFIGKTWNYLIHLNNFDELIKYNKERKIKGYKKILETSKREELEKIKQDNKIQKLREKSLIFYNDLQEFRFDILKETIKYDKIRNNEFYIYCVNSHNRDTIAELFFNLKNKLSNINFFIDNATQTYYNINNEKIIYYNFDKNKIEELKNQVLEALEKIQNNSIFQYIFKEKKEV